MVDVYYTRPMGILRPSKPDIAWNSQDIICIEGIAWYISLKPFDASDIWLWSTSFIYGTRTKWSWYVYILWHQTVLRHRQAQWCISKANFWQDAWVCRLCKDHVWITESCCRSQFNCINRKCKGKQEYLIKIKNTTCDVKSYYHRARRNWWKLHSTQEPRTSQNQPCDGVHLHEYWTTLPVYVCIHSITRTRIHNAYV